MSEEEKKPFRYVVYFHAQAYFDGAPPRSIWRRLQEEPYPFYGLQGIGGPVSGYFIGSLFLEFEEDGSEDEITNIIGGQLAQRIERFSENTTVTQVRFEEITLMNWWNLPDHVRKFPEEISLNVPQSYKDKKKRC